MKRLSFFLLALIFINSTNILTVYSKDNSISIKHNERSIESGVIVDEATELIQDTQVKRNLNNILERNKTLVKRLKGISNKEKAEVNKTLSAIQKKLNRGEIQDLLQGFVNSLSSGL